MIISWFYNRCNREEKEDLILGVAFGLFLGVAFSLLFGVSFNIPTGLFVALLFGLIIGLAIGLPAGLSFGPLVGLSAYLTFSLAFGLVFGLVTGLFPFSVPLLIAIVAAEEILFWLDKEKLPLNRNKISFTAQKKLEALSEIGLAMGIYPYIYELSREVSQIPRLLLLQAALYAFYGAVAIALVVVIILVNSAKYAKQSEH